jgi:hypothetical protein
MRTTSKLLGLAIGIILVTFIVAGAGTKPTFDVDWYGCFKVDGSYDQNQTSHGNFVLWVEQPMYDDNDEQFNMTANETRFGINAIGQGYRNVDVEGRLEFDLYANVGQGWMDDNNALLQLRHAYFSVNSGNFKLVAGQTWDIVSPLNPSTLNYASLWGCGNIGYRRPQISLWYNADPGVNTNITFAGGFFRTFGEDLTPSISLTLGEDSDGADDGTDAGIPSFQGQLDVHHNFGPDSWVRFGGSGLWGQLKAETNFGNYETYESWAASGHLQVNFNPQFGIMGEVFTGNNLGSYLGGILENSTIEGVEVFGGWGSAWVKPSPEFMLAAGVGIDDPDDANVVVGRSRNSCYFGNIQYFIVPQVTLGLEVSYWETDYRLDPVTTITADNVRVQTSFVLSY